MRAPKPNRHAFLTLLTVLAMVALPLAPSGIAPAHAATAQAEPEPGSDEAHPMKAPPPVKLKLGDACQRKTDNIAGKVKRDGCGRWYCGRADMKDIVEIVPNVDRVAHCTWRIQGTRCLCVK
jgi:hypothetical protein